MKGKNDLREPLGESTSPELSATLHSLQERIKEQTCLYEIARLGQCGYGAEELLERAVVLLPQGWQFPDVAAAKIVWAERTFQTANYQETPWTLTTNRNLGDGHEIWVKVCYVQEMPEADEGPFLKEERRLIETIADHLALNLDQLAMTRANQLILQSTEEGIYGIDAQGKCTFMNPAAARMLGYTIEACLGKNMHQLVHQRKPGGEPYPEKDCPIYKASQTDRGCRVEDDVFWKKDGTSFPVRYSSTPILSEGKSEGAVVVFNDITDKKEAERKLAQSEQRYRALVQAGADLTTIVSADGTYKYVSPNYPSIVGFGEKDLLGKNAFNFFHPEDVNQILTEFQQFQTERRVKSSLYRFQHKSGGWRWLRSVGTNLMDDPAIAGIVINSVDVTDLVEVQQELQASEQRAMLSEKRFRALVEHGADAVVILGADGKPTYISPSITRVLGYTEAEAMEINLFDVIHPEDLPQVILKMQEAMAQPGRSMPGHTSRTLHKDGSWRWLEATLMNLLHDPDIRGIVDNFRDVTARVEAHRELTDSEEKYHILFDYSPLPKWIYDLETLRILDVNQTAVQHYGYTREEFLAMDTTGILAPHQALSQVALPNEPDEEGAVHFGVATHRTKGGTTIQVELSGRRLHFKGRECMMVVCNDVTHQLILQQVQRLDNNLMEGSIRMEMGLEALLTSYVLGLEALFPKKKISMLWVVNGLVRNLVSPSLPEAFLATFEGEPIGLRAGSCGTAAYLKQRVIVKDIATDPLWENYREALDFGLKACWSQPILDSGNDVIATLSIYSPEEITPPEDELELFGRRASLLSIILENHLKNRELVSSNERYAYVNKATNDAIYDWDVVNDVYHWGESFQRIFGHISSGRVFRLASWAELMHPDDDEVNRELWQRFMDDKHQNRWHKEFRFRRADGSYAYAEEIGHMIRDGKGRPIRMIGVLRDISATKMAEIQQQVQQHVATLFKDHLSLRETLDRVVRYLRTFGHYLTAEIWLVSSDQQYMNLLALDVDSAAAAYAVQSRNGERLPRGTGLPGRVWDRQRTEVWEDLSANAYFRRQESALRSGLVSAFGIPLYHHDTFIGALMLGSTHPLQPDDQQVQLFDPLSRSLGAEIRRKQQEEEMYLLFHSAPEIMAIASPEGHFVKVNPAFCRLMGYTEAELTTQPFTHFVHPEDLNRTDTEYAETITGERQSKNFINRYRTKSGAYRWISWGSSSVFGEDGFVFSYGRDVTELIELQHMLDTTARVSRLGGWELDLDSQKLFFSQITKEIHEVPDDFQCDLETAIQFYKEGTSRDTIREKVRQALATGAPYEVEVLLVTAKGNERWVRSIGQAEMRDGECVRLFGSFQDIHDRKSAELRLQNTANNIPGVIFQYVLNPDGTDELLFVSQGAVQLWGLEPEVVMRDASEVWKRILPEDIQAMKASIEESARNLTKWNYQWRSKHARDGTIRWMEGHGIPKPMANGAVHWDSVIFDVTEKKELETLLRRASKLARVGSWEIDVSNWTVYWSDVTKEIREADPDFEPTLEIGMEYFKEGRDRETIHQRVRDCVENGTPWDEELQIITFKGNEKWIRTIGEAEFVDGKCVRIYGSFQDIHQRKMAELELMKFHQIIRNSRDGITIANQRGEAVYMNPGFSVMLGHTPESMEVQGGPISVYASQEVAREVFGQLLSGQYWRGDVELVSREGEILSFFLSGGPIFDATGNLMAIYGIHTDISERKRAEQELLRAFEERNTILESIGDAFFAVDKNWVITYWNQEAEKVLGRKRSETVGNGLWEVYPDAVGLKFYTQYHQAVSTGKAVYFEEHYPTTNQWFEVSAYPSEQGLSVYFKDVSIRKVAGEQIRLSNERFQKIAEATNDAIWDFDVQKNELFWGRGFEKLFGYNPDEVTPTFQLLMQLIHPDDRERISMNIERSMTDPSVINWFEEYRLQRKDGSYALVLDRAIFIRNQQGRTTRALGAITDISYRREYEESLRQLNQQLEASIRELATSNQELEQFAYVASHDLQEPLRMITSFLTQLEKKYSDQLDKKAQQYIHFAVDGARRMRNIILDILQFSRVGKHEDELQPLDLAEIVAEVCVLQRQTITEKKAKVTQTQLPVLHTYRSPMLQIFQNLIGNALKYSKPDVAPVIQVTAKKQGDEWLFAVRDNGIGIGEEYYQKIFVIFQRLHLKSEYTGTGMGLAIVKKIVENLGGRIWVESVPDEGSTFYFTLPDNT